MKTEKEDLVLVLIIHREMDAMAGIIEVATTNKIKEVTNLVTIKMVMAKIALMVEQNAVLIMAEIAIVKVVEEVINHVIMVVKVVSVIINLIVTTKVADIIQITNIVRRSKLSIKNNLLIIRNLCV